MCKKINIQNKRAKFEYKFIEEYTAGIVLTGTEIKSLRNSKASISESFVNLIRVENYSLLICKLKNIHLVPDLIIAQSTKKTLLNKKELKKLHKEVKINGLTIVPINLFINEKGLA